MKEADIGIVGAGVVGCAIARKLALSSSHGKKSVIVLEKEMDICMETSRLNSRVIHSGLHEKGELKAKLAKRGSRQVKEYIAKRLPGTILNCGMTIAVSKEDSVLKLVHDIPVLLGLLGRGVSQGIKFRFFGSRGVRKIEPNINARGGIFIPEVSVIDPIALTREFYRDSVTRGVRYSVNSLVEGVEVKSGKYILTTKRGEKFSFSCLINAAGLYADKISAMAGINKYRLYPWRGEYYELINMPKGYIRSLVYPVVSHNSPSKGIHFSIHTNGRIFIGPTARLVESMEDFENNRFPKEIFLEAARNFYPTIGPQNLKPAYAGIRPKLRKDGSTHEDFIIRLDRKDPPLINLIAIESPGLSSSMAIAEYVVKLLDK